MKYIDLHIHTSASDSLLEPEEVVKWAVKKNLKVIGITDHDTVSGIDKAIREAKKYKDLYIVPGIEFSAEYYDEEVHILGYFIDYKSTILAKHINKLKSSRYIRVKKIINKLKKLNIQITFEEVMNIANKGSLGRPHIARVLMNKGYVNSIEEAFEKYIGKDKPAYVNKYKLTIEESINLIHNIGGIAVLAHPGLLNNKNIIEEVIKLKIDGIEIYHPKHTSEYIKHLRIIAVKNSLIFTGGSDCHGIVENGSPILGDFGVTIKQFNKILNKINNNKRSGKVGQYKNERNRQFPSKISTTSFVKLYILHLLTEKSYYGNEIIDEIKNRLNEKWEPSPGMIYPLLRDLEENEYITGWWQEPDKRSIRRYRLTDKGLEHYKKIKLLYKPIFEDSLVIINNTLKDIYKR
jgi:hypothetical protein